MLLNAFPTWIAGFQNFFAFLEEDWQFSKLMRIWPASWNFVGTRYKVNNKTGVINDPLGQTHTHTVSPVENFVFCCFVLLELKSGNVRKYGQQMRKQFSLPAMGWPSGSILWINNYFYIMWLLLPFRQLILLSCLFLSNGFRMEKYRSNAITGKAMTWMELARVWAKDWKSQNFVPDQGCKKGKQCINLKGIALGWKIEDMNSVEVQIKKEMH